ncbi:predicted protein [Aspergillus terreus NIH2624]|uniref:Uncharacterized protein n=1 Tax=Aspergillus terreus (strain NIH 2624 / FGSC A1156) TaxID=341663 RepID=Q0C7M6_ASPTN|nr:uncharacterized protein ATEG_10308 [Aspergillus terreus NIH2624]EAU29305.1 predicted protein [Aspergillus terreus NIH2624]
MSHLKLHGTWCLDKNISDDPDAILNLQGVSWLVRKAIRAASMKLTVTFRSESMEFVMHTMLTGGLTGSSETRIPDWVERLHKDNIFGDVLVRCRFVPGELDAGGNKWPQFDMQSTFYREPDRIEAEEFLKNFTSSVVPAQEKEGRKDSFLHDFVRNESAGWTAEQVWGLDYIGSQKCLKRRIVVTGGGKYETAVFVYRFVE